VSAAHKTITPDPPAPRTCRRAQCATYTWRLASPTARQRSQDPKCVTYRVRSARRSLPTSSGTASALQAPLISLASLSQQQQLMPRPPCPPVRPPLEFRLPEATRRFPSRGRAAAPGRQEELNPRACDCAPRCRGGIERALGARLLATASPHASDTHGRTLLSSSIRRWRARGRGSGKLRSAGGGMLEGVARGAPPRARHVVSRTPT